MVIDELKSKLVEYQKAKDEFRLGALRYLLSRIQEREIELRPEGKEVDDEVVYRVVKKQLKDRNKTLEMFEKAGREDLIEKEKNEISFLEEIMEKLPKPE